MKSLPFAQIVAPPSWTHCGIDNPHPYAHNTHMAHDPRRHRSPQPMPFQPVEIHFRADLGTQALHALKSAINADCPFNIVVELARNLVTASDTIYETQADRS